MGSNFSVVYACLFLAYLENSQPLHPNLFFFTRYIDDAIGIRIDDAIKIRTGTKTQLLDYLNFYSSNTNSCIKLTIQTSPSTLPFLDFWINLDNLPALSIVTKKNKTHTSTYPSLPTTPFILKTILLLMNLDDT